MEKLTRHKRFDFPPDTVGIDPDVSKLSLDQYKELSDMSIVTLRDINEKSGMVSLQIHNKRALIAYLCLCQD